jgi:hypothetical protein
MLVDVCGNDGRQRKTPYILIVGYSQIVQISNFAFCLFRKEWACAEEKKVSNADRARFLYLVIQQ